MENSTGLLVPLGPQLAFKALAAPLLLLDHLLAVTHHQQQ